MKKWLSPLLALILIAGLLTGCSANETTGDHYAAGNGAPREESIIADSASTSAAQGEHPLPESQKMVYKVWLEAETEDLDTLLAGVEERIAELSGYTESQDRHNGSNYSGSRRYRYANLTIRIPSEKMDSFISAVADSANIVSKKQTAENITLSYVATQSRVTALETEQTRLLELLSEAATMSDILEIEKRLTEVRADLEEHTSKLRVYDNLVDYGTIYLDISEVKEYTVVTEPETVWERMGTGFMENLEDLGNFFVDLLVFLVAALPYLTPLAAATTGIILLIRRRKKKSAPPQTKE